MHQVRPHSDVPDEPESARPVLDVVRERRPPFSPEEVVNEFETSVYQGNLATVHRLESREKIDEFSLLSELAKGQHLLLG